MVEKAILAINNLYRSLCVRSLSLNDKAIWASFLIPLVLKVTECTWLSAKSLKRGLNSYFSPVVRNFGRSYARNKINKNLDSKFERVKNFYLRHFHSFRQNFFRNRARNLSFYSKESQLCSSIFSGTVKTQTSCR